VCLASASWILTFGSLYTECHCKVRTNFAHKFHIPKHEKISISICVRKYLIYVEAESVLCRHQKRFSINVWAGIVGDCLVGSHVLPVGLQATTAENSSYTISQKLPEVVPLTARALMWYLHDGAPANFSHAMREVLNNIYHDRWIGRRGPTAWHPRSPDMNPLDVLPVGTSMQLLLTTKRHFIAVWMPVRLSAATPVSLHGCGGPCWGVSRRALNLMEDILSTYYKRTISPVSHKLCFRTHVDMNIFSRFGIWNSCPNCPRLWVPFCIKRQTVDHSGRAV
jgi:hypothetical protein